MDARNSVAAAFNVGRALGHGIAAVRIAAGPMWLAGLLVSIADGCGSPGSALSMLGSDDEPWAGLWLALPRAGVAFAASALTGAEPSFDWRERAGWIAAAIAAFVVAMLLGAVLLLALSSWVQTGSIRVHINILERSGSEVGPLFSGRDRFRDMFGYKVLAGLLVWASALVAAWPGLLLAYYGHARDSDSLAFAGVFVGLALGLPAALYAGLGTYLGELVVALEGEPPVRALRRSFALARGNRLQLFLFAFSAWVIQAAGLAGLLLCCVGALATVPLAHALTGFAKTESYLLFTRGFEQTAGWQLWQPQRKR